MKQQDLIKGYVKFELVNAEGVKENTMYANKQLPQFPKYVITEQTGVYLPFEALKSKDGNLYVYLMESRNQRIDTPALYLQAKDSLNVTGLNDMFLNGWYSGIAYGYPIKTEKYGAKKPRNNPFFPNNTQDAFIFFVTPPTKKGEYNDMKAWERVPPVIEMLILDKARLGVGSYAKYAQMGGFNEELEQWQGQAKKAWGNAL